MNTQVKDSSRIGAAAAASRPNLVGEPTEFDIILGRGSSNAWRPGNAYFHEILDRRMTDYLLAGTKKAKRAIIQEIYDAIDQRSGRFLEKDEQSDSYTEIDEDEALTKIGYAVRYRKKKMHKAASDMVSGTRPTVTSSPGNVHEERRAESSGQPRKRARMETHSSSSSSRPPSPPPLPPPVPARGSQVAQETTDIISDEELRSVLDSPGDNRKPPPLPPSTHPR